MSEYNKILKKSKFYLIIQIYKETIYKYNYNNRLKIIIIKLIFKR